MDIIKAYLDNVQATQLAGGELVESVCNNGEGHEILYMAEDGYCLSCGYEGGDDDATNLD